MSDRVSRVLAWWPVVLAAAGILIAWGDSRAQLSTIKDNQVVMTATQQKMAADVQALLTTSRFTERDLDGLRARLAEVERRR